MSSLESRWTDLVGHSVQPIPNFGTPLRGFSLMFDYQLYALMPAVIIWPTVSCISWVHCCIFWLFCRMTGAIWKSAFVAALFALHPLHVESVAWIAERKDVLSGFFWMLTLCLYVYYTEKPAIKRYLLVLFSFVCGSYEQSPWLSLCLSLWFFSITGRWDVFQSHKSNWYLWQLKKKYLFYLFNNYFHHHALCSVQAICKTFFFYSRIANAPVSFVTYWRRHSGLMIWLFSTLSQFKFRSGK